MKKYIYFFYLLCLTPFLLKAQNAMPNFNLNRLGGLSYNEALSGVWGYETATQKYAIVGTWSNYTIVNITDPTAPDLIYSVYKGGDNYWAEVNRAGNYIFGVADATNLGIFVADLSDIDNGNVTHAFVKPTVTIDGIDQVLDKGHALFIDENNILYISGSNVNNGNVVMFDITDPFNPLFLGAPSDGNYAHDCYARGDTLWIAHMYLGAFTAYDVSDKANPVFLASHNTPSNFTHNIGISSDGNYLFTTDERGISWLAAYDVSDLDNIKEVDRYRSRGEELLQIVPHNVYIKNDFAILAHYTDGLVILDASRPSNLVEVAYYSTYTGTDSLYNGAWGAYPYYSDNTIIVGDIQTGLHIFEPQYQRACWLEGVVTDSLTNLPIFDAKISFTNAQRMYDNTDLSGNYATGHGVAGTYSILVQKEGYYPKTIMVELQNGVVTIQNIALKPWPVSMDDLAYKSNMKVYPNPFSSSFFVEIGDMAFDNIKANEANIFIYNTLGQIVEQRNIQATDRIIEMGAELPNAGIYFIKMPNSLSQKIIKK